jgi:hypothetical protein
MSKTVKDVLRQIGAKRQRRKSGGDKKHDRHKAHCAIYRARGRREFNKARKQRLIAKMLAKKALRKERKSQ